MQIKMYYGIFLLFSIFTFSPARTQIIEFELKRMKSPYQRMLEGGMDLKHINMFYGTADKNASVPLFRYMDNEFYGAVRIGHPGRLFNVIFDTSWANSWVPSSLCPDTVLFCSKHQKYDSSQSSTFKADGRPIAIGYGKEFLKGILATDLFHLGQKNVTSQTFAEMESIPDSYLLTKSDGVLGLAFQTISYLNVTPFLDNMILQKTITRKVFSFYFNRNKVSPKGGTLFLGGSQKKHYTGNFTYVNLIASDYWRFGIESIHVKGDTVDYCGGNKCPAIVDTSSTLISVPKSVIGEFRRAVKSMPHTSGRYQVDCAKISTLPAVTFNIAGKNFNLKARDYIQKIGQWCLTVFQDSEMDGEFANYWTIGASFMARFYVEFDAEKKRIGFADVRM